MLAAQANAGTEPRWQYWMAPPRSPGPSSVPTNSGRWPGQRFSKKEPAVDAVGEPSQGDAAALDVGQHRGGDADVVVDDLGLREPHLGIEDLVEVRQLEPLAGDLDDLVGHGAGVGADLGGRVAEHAAARRSRRRWSPRAR